METFSEFKEIIGKERYYVLDSDIPLSNYIPIDLSSENNFLQNIDVSSPIFLGKFIDDHIKKNRGTVGFGGYRNNFV